jgi:sugar lactone lactonase YvrE
VDSAGNIFVADGDANSVRKVTPTGVVTTVAGSTAGAALDGVGTAARFQSPAAIAIDAADNLYVADTGNSTIRRITPAGVVTTLAGSARLAGAADGTGSTARFNEPRGVAVDATGIVYVADSGNGTIRKVTQAGVVTTLAGFAGTFGWGDGTGASATFAQPWGIAVDRTGNVFVCEYGAVRRISPAGVVKTVAGDSGGTLGSADGTETARFEFASGIAVDPSGILYVADQNGTIRRGIASTITLAVRMGNLSVRTTAGAGAQTLIVGFVVADGPKSLLIRGIGPSLAQFGVTGALADPELGLFSGATRIATNNDWGTALNAAQVVSVTAALGGFPLTAGSRDAALLTMIGVGAYSAQLSGADGGTGVALVELYDADAAATARFFNASARAEVGTGAGILIAGFTVAGNTPKTVLVRGVGPTLTTFSVPGVLADPQLKIFRGDMRIDENDDWGESAGSGGQLAAAAAQVGAFALRAGSKDAALLLSLRPGSYTAQLSGTNGTTGVALVEVYEVP